MKTPQQYWQEFRSAFCQALDQTDVADLKKAWGDKKPFYEFHLMPAVGQILGQRMQVEYMRVDYTFFDENEVPVIAVESENGHTKAWEEIERLSSLATPLKVLILSCDWAEAKQKYLSRWTDIIRRYHQVVSVDCLYAIIVGEWENEQRPIYTLTLVDTNGQVLEESKDQAGA